LEPDRAHQGRSFGWLSTCWSGAPGWCWKPIAPQLRNQGRDAYPVTLSGLGERSHLASPEVDLETHITDAVNLIEFEDLRDVFLLGHSYAGIVVTGAADRIPERIAQLVYLDSGPVPDGPVRLADLGGVDGPGGLLDRRAT
jgi:pimeloyl-ACP methyl ester carboxylesterase